MRRARNLAVDVSCVVVAVLVGLTAAADGLDSGTLSDERLLLSLAVTLPAIVLLWWRRRHPVAVALLMLVPAAVTEVAGGAAAIAVFTVAVHRRLRTAVWVAVAHFVVSIPLSVLHPDPDLQVVGANGIGLVIMAALVAWGSAVRNRRLVIATLRERAARAEAETEQRAEVLRGLERERIAREMHDVLAHRISLISLHAGALEIRGDLSREQVVEAGATIRSSARQAMEELREILGVLRTGDDDELRPRQDLADLDELVGEARRAGATVHLDNRVDDPQGMPAAVNRTAFRLVQEGLTNARKHAPGEEVSVLVGRCEERPDQLYVRLRNPLPMLPVPPGLPGSRSGLVGLGERVALAGGRIQHGPRRGDGEGPHFTLEAWLPWGT
ncbi:histidine kinase [Dactylosporangium sp. NPDC051485]|uniref:sensor histidine kinase n=1 Tax=Dactylosporangium sp. NPDC051485 TaxID=3154846 RepID=UPI003436B865